MKPTYFLAACAAAMVLLAPAAHAAAPRAGEVAPNYLGNPERAAEVLRLGAAGPRNAITSGASAVLALADNLRVTA